MSTTLKDQPKTAIVPPNAASFQSIPHANWPEWMAPDKAAAYIDGSVSTLAKLRLRGGGPVFCRIGHAIRYRRSDLDEWLLLSSRRSTSDGERG